MSQPDSAARKSNDQSVGQEQELPRAAEMDEELSRFAHRLAGFGLGEVLDALLARRDFEESDLRPDTGPEPC